MMRQADDIGLSIEAQRFDAPLQRLILRDYGAENEAEFFAVATETFFEKPKQLRAADADLYALLSEYYGVDPANGLAPTEHRAQVLTPPSP